MRTFCGVLTRVNCWSDGCPIGARGHRVWLEWEAAMRALPTLTGSPLFDGHNSCWDVAETIGHINWADIIGDEVWIAGETWRPLLSNELSFEITDCEYKRTRPNRYMINKFIFSGASCVPRGAYKNTWIEVLEDSNVVTTTTDLAIL